MAQKEESKTFPKASWGEIFAWAMYDFANSSYSTVVATAIFNAYFVQVVAAGVPGLAKGGGTLLLTIAISVSSLLIVISAPVLGAIADAKASKKQFLLISTLLCVTCTAFLSRVGPGDLVLGMCLLITANFAFGTGENLIAAFLPEIAAKEQMGRVSALGWTIGYVGGLSVLTFCLVYVSWAQKQGLGAVTFVPITMLITAACFALGSTVTLTCLKERAFANPLAGKQSYLTIGFRRLKQTLTHVSQYKDLFRFLGALLLYSSGMATVIALASLYAQEVMGFKPSDSITLILVVNITAAVGAFVFGFIQDKIGSVRTLAITLTIWAIATAMVSFAGNRLVFWLAANLIGVAMGSSQSAGRALIGQFSPQGRSAEFFGLWGVVVKLAGIIGPLSYGAIAYLSHNNCRLAVLSTTFFFLAGLIVLFAVNEKRGKETAEGSSG